MSVFEGELRAGTFGVVEESAQTVVFVKIEVGIAMVELVSALRGEEEVGLFVVVLDEEASAAGMSAGKPLNRN